MGITPFFSVVAAPKRDGLLRIMRQTCRFSWDPASSWLVCLSNVSRSIVLAMFGYLFNGLIGARENCSKP